MASDHPFPHYQDQGPPTVSRSGSRHQFSFEPPLAFGETPAPGTWPVRGGLGTDACSGSELDAAFLRLLFVIIQLE